MTDGVNDEQLPGAAELLAGRGLSLDSVLADVSDTPQEEQVESEIVAEDLTSNHSNFMDGFDPSQPLSDPKDEEFLRIYLATNLTGAAWRESRNTSASAKSCSEQGSRKLKEKPIALRLRFLRQQEIERAKDSESPVPAGAPMSIARQKNLCHLIMRRAETGAGSTSDAIRAMEYLKKIEEAEKDEKVRLKDLDPAELCDYFREAEEQGVDVAAMALGESAEGTGPTVDDLGDSRAAGGVISDGGAQDVVGHAESEASPDGNI